LHVVDTPFAAAFIDDRAARGLPFFTSAEAERVLGRSTAATRAALRRLQARVEIAAPFRGFFVIVPPEYRRLGCLPAEQFVPALMAHLEVPYYAALLSAAELHGAAHHRPQEFQVMVPTNRRPIACGSVRVRFFARRDHATTPVVEKRTPRGPLRVSSPEATALELVGYASSCGGLDHVAGVIGDLAETLDPDRLLAESARCPVVWAQRLGHLLDLAGRSDLGDALHPAVVARAPADAPLVRAVSKTGARRVGRWKLALNGDIEPAP
jgi:predicted transcriptional regulator of viral defense system